MINFVCYIILNNPASSALSSAAAGLPLLVVPAAQGGPLIGAWVGAVAN